MENSISVPCEQRIVSLRVPYKTGSEMRFILKCTGYSSQYLLWALVLLISFVWLCHCPLVASSMNAPWQERMAEEAVYLMVARKQGERERDEVGVRSQCPNIPSNNTCPVTKLPSARPHLLMIPSPPYKARDC
jgi:hypothetical protein